MSPAGGSYSKVTTRFNQPPIFMKITLKFLAFPLLIIVSLMMFSCNPPAEPNFDFESYEAEIKAFPDELTGEKSWLNLAGLFWLEEGITTFGSSTGNEVVFPLGTDYLGQFNLMPNGQMMMTVNDGNEVFLDSLVLSEPTEMHSDTSALWNTFAYQSLRWHRLDRSEKTGIRLRNLESEAVKTFTGLRFYPTDVNYRIKATLEPVPDDYRVRIVNILGLVSEYKSAGVLVFNLNRNEFRFETIDQDETMFIIFSDQTNGTETYGGGRFIDIPMPDENGNIWIDFNTAYNPACAFTELATCPIPPAANKMPISVPAGEQKYIFADGSVLH